MVLEFMNCYELPFINIYTSNQIIRDKMYYDLFIYFITQLYKNLII